MSVTDVIDSGIPLPRIGEVSPIGPLRVRVTWVDGARAGRTDELDLSPLIKSYKIYRPLRDNEALFHTVHLIEDGHAIAWEAHDLEMSAETIETLAEETMTPAEFAEFLARNHLTQEAAAAIFDRSRRQIGYYLNPGPVPRVIALACYGYEARKRRHASASSVVRAGEYSMAGIIGLTAVGSVTGIYELKEQPTTLPKPKIKIAG